MMRKTIFGFSIAVFFMVAAIGCGGGSQPTAQANTSGASGNADQGKGLYAQSCSACHGQDAKGMAGLGKDLVDSAFVKSQSDDALLAFIKAGRPTSDAANTTGMAMPPKGGNPALQDDDLKAIIAFVRSLAK